MTGEALQELLDDMSLAEKIGQMNQVIGSFYTGEFVATGPMADKGFTEENISPLCLLVNAYRRVDKGTKCLFAPNDLAKRYAAEFRKGTRDYLDDTKWWKAAQEEDQKNGSGTATTAVNTGTLPSDGAETGRRLYGGVIY